MKSKWKHVSKVYINLLTNNKEDEKENSKLNNLNYLIMYLINSVPIPDVESNVAFYIPCNDPSKNLITLPYPKLEGFSIEDDLYELFFFEIHEKALEFPARMWYIL